MFGYVVKCWARDAAGEVVKFDDNNESTRRFRWVKRSDGTRYEFATAEEAWHYALGYAVVDIDTHEGIIGITGERRYPIPGGVAE